MTRTLTTPFEESRYKADKRGYLHMRKLRQDSVAIEQEGIFTHPLGTVEVWTAHWFETGTGWTTLAIVAQGHVIRRRWRRAWRPRTIPGLCRDMLQEHLA